jgi:hypothetical protein
MKRFKQHFYSILLVIYIGTVCQWLYAGNDAVPGSEGRLIELIAPFGNKKVMNGPMVFLWKPVGSQDTLHFDVRNYEVTFWTNNHRFVKSYSVSPPESYRTVSLQFDNCRSVFRRHGKYFWQVAATDAAGNQISSEVRSFTIEVSELIERPAVWHHPYGVHLYYANRLRTMEYMSFLDHIYPTKHMRNYSDFGLVFQQQRIGTHFLEFEERFNIRSQIGMGMDVGIRFRLLQNRFFSLYPLGQTGMCWYATGIEKYSSLLHHVLIGCDYSIMPKGYITIRGGWIPLYRVRYSEKEKRPRTYLGKGWEMGVQLIIPQTVLKSFRFLGIEINFQRMPISYRISRIQDQYTGTVMKIQGMGIGYFFQ